MKGFETWEQLEHTPFGSAVGKEKKAKGEK